MLLRQADPVVELLEYQEGPRLVLKRVHRPDLRQDVAQPRLVRDRNRRIARELLRDSSGRRYVFLRY